MLEHATVESHRPAGGMRSRLAPALARAFGSGALVLALALFLYVLAASLGEWLAGEPPAVMAHLASAPVYRELAAIFLASSAALFVIREFGVGSR